MSVNHLSHLPLLPLQVAQPAAASPLLTAAYEALSQLDLDAAGDDAAELATLTAEMQSTGAQVRPLLGVVG